MQYPPKSGNIEVQQMGCLGIYSDGGEAGA